MVSANLPRERGACPEDRTARHDASACWISAVGKGGIRAVTY